MRTRTPGPLTLVALLLLAAGTCPGQSTASLTGSVTDPSGAAIPGARIVCRNLDTGQQTGATTTSSGLFDIPNLLVGSYEVAISHQGFATAVRSRIELLTGQTVDLSTTLKVGEASQSLTITAESPLVQATTSEVRSTVDSRQMSDLPLNGRNAFDLAVLSPGATTTDASTTPGQQDNPGLSVNGFLATQNNWQLDGGTYNNLHFGSSPTLPNPDTLQEFTIQTSNFSAESRGGGAVVKLTTRSGGNDFHGSLFEFLRNTELDTRNFFSTNPEPYKQNQYGGTGGGPIRRNRLFFFGSYQGTKRRGSPSPTLFTVPTAAQHTGDFSKIAKIVVDPATNVPYPDNIIPQSRIDPVAAKLMPYYQLPNYGSNGYLENAPANRDDDQWMAKVDYSLGSRDLISTRYFWDRNTLDHDEATMPGFLAHNRFTNQTFLISDTHTFNSSWIVHTAFNYLRTFRNEAPVSPITMQQLGVQVQPAKSGIPDKIYVNVSGYAKLFTGRGILFEPQVSEVQADVSHNFGRHFLRFGTGMRRDAEYALNLADELGNWTFNAQRTTSSAVKNSGEAIGSLLLGLPSTFVQSTAAPQNFVLTTFDPWIQDDWRPSRRLTLNLGVRWEPWLPPTDSLGPLTGFVPGARSTVAPLVPRGLLYSGDPGIPASILHTYRATFSPRLGFAWDVTGGGKLIVRGGYGIFRAGTEFFGMQRTFASTIPGRGGSVSITNPPSTANPLATFTGTLPWAANATGATLSSLTIPSTASVPALDPASKPQYAQSWNLTIERQLAHSTVLAASYVGNHTLHGMMAYLADPAVYGPGATVSNEPSRMLYPGFSNITLGTSAAHGNYHSLQLQFTKRLSHGLTALANYTYSKVLDISTAGAQGVSTNVGPRDPYNLNLDKGPADTDLRQQFKTSVVYEIPSLRTGSQVLRALARGWQINTIFTVRTGLPFTCRSGADNSLTGIGLDHCDQVSSNISRPAGVDPVFEWFNTAAFATNAAGTFGTTGRNSLRRPGAHNLNASIFRTLKLAERVRLELRAEAFNLLNHPSFDLFTSSGGYVNYVLVSSPTFGQLTSASDPRLFQFALKLRF